MTSLKRFVVLAVLLLASCKDSTVATAAKDVPTTFGPYVDAVLPAKGPTAGGTVVLIRGEKFSPEAVVLFGTLPSPKVVVADGRTLTAVTPQGEGVVDLTVKNPEGTLSTLAQGFSYENVAGEGPTLTRAVPAQGPMPGGSLIELSGKEFAEGALAFVGGRPASAVTVISPTLLTLVTPSGNNGPAELAITNPDGRSAVLAGGFAYFPADQASRPPPRIAVVEPDQGSTLGGDAVFISGTGFVPGIRVYLGGRPADRLTLEAARLQAVTPPGSPGLVDLFVTNPDGQSHSVHGYNYFQPVPLVSRIEPVVGPIAGGTAVVIHGRNFTKESTASIGGKPVADLILVDPQTLKGTTPRGALAGWQDVQVITGPGKDLLPLSFFYVDADHPDPGGSSAKVVVARATPVSHPDSGGSLLTLIGGGFQTGLTATINGVAATEVKVVSASVVTLKMPPGKVGFATIEVENPDKGRSKLEGVAFYFSVASTGDAPKVAGITPALGPTTGGTRLVITGSNFQNASKVYFGTAESTRTRTVSDTELTAEAPAAAAGTVGISVVNSDGRADTLPGAFTYYVLGAAQLSPKVTAIAPSSGSATGETPVTLTGGNFQSGALVFAGDFPASKVAVSSATEITATMPPGAAGRVDVLVVNPDGTTGKLSSGFEYKQLPPVLSAITPKTGPLAGAISVLLIGKDLTKGATVSFGGNASTDVRYLDSTVLKALVPAGTPGKVDVVVTNADGQKFTLAAAFEYDPSWVAGPKPSLVDVQPARGSSAGGTLVYLKGSGFTPGATVLFGDGRATEVTVVDDKTASAITPAGPKGAVHVTLLNADGQLAVLTSGFSYLDPAMLGARPELTGVTPASGRESASTAVVLAGKNFGPGAFVFFGGALGLNPSQVSSSAYAADAPPHAPGSADVAITSADGQTAFLRGGFSYVARPRVTALAPGGGTTSGGTKVVLTGTGFQAGATVSFGGVAATAVLVRSATSIECTTAAAPAGAADVTVTNADKQLGTLTAGFVFVGPPGIDSAGVSPASGPNTGGTIAILKGSGFVPGSTVTIGGKPAVVEVIDANTVVVEIPSGTTGAVDVSLRTPDGQTALGTQLFTYKDPAGLGAGPTLGGALPATGPVGGGTRLSVSGTNFSSGALIFFALRPASSLVISGTLASVKSPAGAGAGKVALAITNADGQTVKLANGFEYLDPTKLGPAPTLDALLPDKATVFGGSVITATGKGFTGATFYFGGRPADASTITSSTQAALTAPVGNPGPTEVVVTSADGQTAIYKGAFDYVVPPPEPLAVSPNSGTSRGGVKIAITGRNFQSGASVTVGGAACAGAKVIDPSSIECTTPAGVDGPAVVRVINADGKGSSLANGFTYFSPPEPLLVSPSTVSSSGGTKITLLGRSFQPGALVTVGGNACTAVKVVDASTVECLAPAGTDGVAAVTVTNADGRSGSIANGLTYVSPPEPLVVSPSSGASAGGTRIAIAGRKFQSGAQITVAGSACQSITFVDATSLTCTTPPGADGVAAVKVTNPDGFSASLASGFTYVAAPTVTAVSPSAGPVSGGTVLTLTGTFFRTGVAATVGGAPCTSLTRVSPTQITCASPTGTAGAAVIAVTNTDGQSGTLAGAFAYEAPLSISRLSPPTGPDKGGITVTVFGSNFKSGATVSVGAVPAAAVRVLDGGTLSFTLPAGAKGLISVTVTNPDGGQITFAGGFSYYDSTSSAPFPTLSRVAPNLGPLAGNTRVQLGGAAFASGLKVYLGGIEVAGPRVLDATLIVGETPSTTRAGAVPVTVVNPDGKSDTLFSGFAYYAPAAGQKAPAPVAISPATGSSRASTAVTVTGTDFAPGALVYAGDWPASAASVASATSLSATIAAQASSTVDVVVVNPDGLVGRINSGFQFKVPPPTLTGVRPARGPLGGNITALVLGDNFDRGATVTFGRSVSSDVKYVDATALTALVPSGVAGKVDVTVTNLDGQSATLPLAFEYDPNWVAGPKPGVSSVQPPRGPTTGGSAVLVRGTNFVSGATVLFADLAATDVNLVDARTLYVVTPAASAGPAHVTVINPDGQLAVLAGGFSYVDPSTLGRQPTLSGTSPTSGAETATTNVLLTGGNFRSGAFVYFGGFPAANPLVLSPTIYQADALPHAPGAVDVAITNADGTSAVLKGGFTYIARPTLTSATPTSGPTVGGTKVLITGEAFQGGATVSFAGVAATSVNVRSPTLLDCVTPAGTAGLADIGIKNPDQQTATLVKGFTYVPPPSFSATPINPASGPTTGGTIAIIKGQDFVVSATVTVAGKAAVVEVIDSSTIAVEIPAGAIGFSDVNVKNPDGQQASATRAWVYKDPASLGARPTLSSLSPAKGPKSGGTLAALSGGNFASGSLVFFGLRPASGVTYVAADTLTALSPAGNNLGKVFVAVTNPDGQTAKVADLFDYTNPTTLGPAPVLSALAPQQASVFGGTSIAAGGANFVSGAQFFFAGRPAASTTINSATSATVLAPTGSAGPAAVAMTNPDGQTAAYKGAFDYIVPPPSPQLVSPNQGTTRGGTLITITGQSFQSGATVQLSGAPCTSTTTVNPTKITCTTPAGVDGPANVKVINSDGQSSSLANGYTYVASPDPQKVSPTSGPVAGGTSVNITGAFFAPGLTVTIAGKSCNNTTRVSASLITCDVPAGTAGPAAVTVTNPDGQNSTIAAGFTYLPPVPAPSLTSVSPNYGSIRGGSGVTLVGTSFQVGATVFFGTIPSGQVTVASNTSIACSSPAQSAGMVSVTVTNPDGQSTTLASSYQYLPDTALPPISVSQIVPNTGATSGGTQLTITGNGFQAGLAVTIGGVLCNNITRLGPTGINCITPPGVAGAVPVAVTNPDGTKVIVNNGFTYDIGGRYVTEGHTLPMESSSGKRGVLLVDIDKDNDLDFFMTTMSGGFTNPWLQINNGSGLFSFAQQNLPPLCGSGACEPNTNWQVRYQPPVAVDMNKDGATDLVFLTEHQVVVYLNDGGGKFTRNAFNVCPDQSNGTRGADARGFSVGDFDRDGDIDIAVARWSGTVNCWSAAANAYVNINGEVVMENMFTGITKFATYDFENLIGSTTTPDGSGQGNTLTLSGAALVASGHTSQGLSLNGTSGFATAPNSVSLNPQTFTLSAWVFQTGNFTTNNTIVAKENQYTMAVNNGQLQLAVQPLNGAGWAYVGSGTVPQNTWTQVMASYDGVGIRTYVNGVLTSFTPWGYGPANTTANVLSVGRRQFGGEYFAGKIDEVLLQTGTGSAAGANLVARYNKIPQIPDESVAIQSGDVDGDGDLDLIVVNDLNIQNRLYLNNGLGTFTDVSATQLGVSAGNCRDVQFGDMDKDGDLDLFIARFNQRTLLYANDGFGKFTDVTLTSRLPVDLDATDRLWLVDIDNDSDLDLITKKAPTATLPQPIRVYVNDGTGFYGADRADALLPVSRAETLYDLAFGDVNKDGYLDMVWMQEGYTNRLLLNDTTGKFKFKGITNLPEENANNQDAVAVDVDLDGDKDLVVCGEGTPGMVTKLWLNDGAGNYVDVTSTRMPNILLNCRDVDVADVNKDGAPDLLVTSTSDPGGSPSSAKGASVYLFINDGRGNFRDETFPRLPNDSTNRGVAPVTIEPIDYDGDGDLDLIVGNNPCTGTSTGSLRLWQNLGLNTGYFVDVTQTSNLVLPSINCSFSNPDGRVEDIQVGKIDTDGLFDMFLVRNTGGNMLFFNTPSAGFKDVTAAKMASPQNGKRAVLFDADLDGDLDIYLANYGNDRLYFNTGDGLYSDVSPANLPARVDETVGVVFADADRDGDPDIILAKRNRAAPRILMNIGFGKYQDYSSTNAITGLSDGKIPIANDSGQNLVKGLFNADGFEDLLILNAGQSRILVNQP